MSAQTDARENGLHEEWCATIVARLAGRAERCDCGLVYVPTEDDALCARLRHAKPYNCLHSPALLSEVADRIATIRRENNGLHWARTYQRQRAERAEAERDALREEIERERMRTVACGVAALENTRESAIRGRLPKSNEYWTPSYQDVCNSVDKQMNERERAERAEAELVKPKEEIAQLTSAIDGHIAVRLEAYNQAEHAEDELEAARIAGKALYDASQQLIAERDALKQRCEGYQASRDWAIDRLAGCLGVEADKLQAVEYYADQAAMKIDALRKHLQSATERRTGFNPDADAARAKEPK